MKDELDKIEATVDQVLAPERALRWLVRIVVLMVTIGAVVVVGKALWHMNTKVDQAVQEVEQQETHAAEQATLTHDWFVLKKDAIDACGLEIKAAREALARQTADASSRMISRESDRKETARLNSAVTDAQRNRLSLIRDYNEKATRVNVVVLGDLPKHIEVVELSEPDKPEVE